MHLNDRPLSRQTSRRARAGRRVLYGVVSARTEKVVEFFLERNAAEAMIEEVCEDEPELAAVLRVEEVEFGS